MRQVLCAFKLTGPDFMTMNETSLLHMTIIRALEISRRRRAIEEILCALEKLQQPEILLLMRATRE